MKKWTYLVAAGMLLGATPVLTGCIDNDEPEGITVLRGAKAELLKAKASVTAAMVEQVKAEAALKLAEAEVKKAEAARVKAMADYEAARAKEMEYKAELANIQNEEKRAELENQIKIYAEQRAAAEREAKKAAAALEVSLMELKAQLATQEALYETALKDLALAKNTLTAAQKAHLSSWEVAVSTANEDVKTKAEAYQDAAKTLATAIKTMDQTEAKESYLRTQKKAVADAQVNLEAAIAARDLAKEYADKKIEGADKWEAEMTKLEAELDAIKIRLANLQVDREKLVQDNKGLLADAETLRGKYMGITGYTWNHEAQAFNTEIGRSAEQITLAEVNIVIDEPAISLKPFTFSRTPKFYYSNKLTAEQEGGVFTLKAKKDLLDLKQTILDAKLSPNGIAWTEEQLAMGKIKLARIKEEAAAEMAKWEVYVKAYKNFEHGDPTPFEGFAAIEEAIAEYNKAVKAHDAATIALNAFLKKYDDIFKDYTVATMVPLEKFVLEMEKITLEYKNTIVAIDDNLEDLENKKVVANTYYSKCAAEFALIVKPTDADRQKVTDALKASDDAGKAYEKAFNEAFGYISEGVTVVGTKEKAAILRDKKYQVANTTRANELAKIQEAYQKEHPENEYLAQFNALDAAKEAALQQIGFVENQARQVITIFASNHTVNIDRRAFDAASSNIDEEVGSKPLEIAAKDAARIDMESLLGKLVISSENLFGETKDNKPAYLVVPTVAEMNAAIEKEFMSIFPEATFIPYAAYIYGYNGYGLFGKVLGGTAEVLVGESILRDNGAKVNQYAAQVQSEIDKIDTQIEIYTNTVVVPAFEAYNVAFVMYNSKFVDVDNAIVAAKAERASKKPVLDKIQAAIKVYLSQEMNADGTPANPSSIQDLREILQAAYDAAVTNAYNYETTLINAKEALQAVINGTKQPVEVAQENVAEKQKALEAAQAELKAAVAALQAEIERISAQ